MMKNKQSAFVRTGIFLLLTWCCSLQGCKDLYEDQVFTAYEELPIGMYLKARDTTYGQWVALLEHAGLYATMNLQTSYTAFIPTNAGVERYLQAQGYASVTDIPKEEAAYLAKYHTIHGVAIDLGQFQSGAINELNETDDKLSIEVRDGGLDSFYLNGTSRFLEFDIEVTNGVLHAIEDVLVPLTATLADQLEENYPIFYDAAVAAGYETMLNTVYTDETDPQGNPIQVRYRYTVFAVSDATYAADGVTGLDALIEKLGAGSGPYDDPANPLHQYVAYHLLDQWRSFVELGEFPEDAQEKNINTMAENQLVQVSDRLGELLVNFDASEETGLRFVAFDIPAKNGVIHEVDGWMPLFTPASTTVIWELTDYADLAANVEQYRNPDLGAQYNRTFEKDELTSFFWVSQPEDRTGVLTYRNNRAADGSWYAETLNHDHLRLLLGESGWIEMESPVIVKGTYNLKFVWPSPRQTSASGICSFALDGQMIKDRLTISNTSSDRALEESLGTVTFDETTSHTLRVVSLDGKLITMDYIRFEPVDN